jgi:monovalent cation/hydrogen antiporter
VARSRSATRHGLTLEPPPTVVTLELAAVHLGPIELVFLVLVVATGLAYLARRLHIAEPILLLVGGVAMGLVFEGSVIQLEPDVVFLLFLPPILFAAAYFTPIRDFKANLRPILLLAIGLVLFTTIVVGVVVQWLVPGIPPAAAFTFGAIVAPPDAVAATAVFRRLGVPRRIVTILEGESLINDASSLTAYRAATLWVATATFSLAGAAVDFVVVGAGGIAVGIIVGKLVTRALHKTGDPTLEIILTLIAPIAAYLGAELIGVSGVLATVTAGLITGRRAARVLSPDARLMGYGTWSTVIWLINAFVFMLLGLQLPAIIRDLSDYSALQLAGLGIAVSLTVILARFAWVFPATYLPRRLSRSLRERDPSPSPRAIFIISWAGMRGVVSLAAALALAADFPQRELILFLTFCVIVATLVGQGLTLPWLIRRLGVVARSGPDTEVAHARLAAVEAALGRLDELVVAYPDHLELIEQLRAGFDHEASHVWPHADRPLDEAERELLDHGAIRMSVVAAQRDAVIGLRDDGIINDQTLRQIERDLDLEALRAGA